MITIRRAEFADLEFLRAFAEFTFRVAYEAQNDLQVFNDYCATAFASDKFRAEMQHPESEFYFASQGEARVGYLKINFDEHPPEVGSARTLQIQRIYITPAMQGRGVGRQLLDFAEKRAVEKGLEWIWLTCWKKAPDAVAFYQHCGFEICGTASFPLGDEPQQDWMMRRRVTMNYEL